MFADVLNEAMTRHKVTQSALHRRMRHPDYAIRWDRNALKTQIAGWCHGVLRPRFDVLVCIADALQLTGDERARLFAAANYWPDEWPLPEVA